MTSFSTIESWSILDYMNLAGPIEHEKLQGQGDFSRKSRWRRAREAKRLAAEEQNAHWKSTLEKTRRSSSQKNTLEKCAGDKPKAPDAAASSHRTGLEAPPGFFLPVGFTPPPGLAPLDGCHPALPQDLLLPVGFTEPFAFPHGCHPALPPGLWSPKTDGLGIDDLIESGAEDTSVGTGPTEFFSVSDRVSDRDENESEAEEEFPMQAFAPCFRSTSLSPVLTNSVSDREETEFEAEDKFQMQGVAPCFRSTSLSPVLTNSVCRFDSGSLQHRTAIQIDRMLTGKLRHQYRVSK